MVENNFYEWLGLPVEEYEGDVTKLKLVLDRFITDCNSSKDTKKQNRAAIYQAEMKSAIQDPVLWRKIYEEYKRSVDEKIVNYFVLCADSSKCIPQNQVNMIASKFKVSVPYIEQSAKDNGYKTGKTSAPAPESGFKLKDLEPESKAKSNLDSIQKAINELGFPTLAELIESETGSKISISDISKDDLSKKIDSIKKKWSKVSPNDNKKSQQKSNFDRICSGMKTFLKSYEISVYTQYIVWKNTSNFLNDMRSQLNSLGLESLNNNAYKNAVNSIYSLINDRVKAESVLNAYCEEKGISYPKPIANIAVCPYCSNNFEKKNPLQTNCPSCNKSFIVSCPVCGKKRNFLSEGSCDGIDLLQFPYLEYQLQETQQILDTLDITGAKVRIEEIVKKWNNFPGSAEVISKCKSLETSYGSDLKKLKSLCDSHRYYEAKIICDRLGATYPKFKTANKGVYDTVIAADNLYKACKAEKDADKRVEILLEVLALAADHPEANADIRADKLSPIQELKGVPNADGNTVVLSWKSQNKPNSVYYNIRKKNGTPVSNHADGDEISVTQSTSFSDSEIAEGEAYYYAVYANRGPVQTPLNALQKPFILLKKPDALITPKDASVSVSWNYSAIEIKVFLSDEPIKNYGEGTPCKGITPTGVDIENLTNGRKYYIGLVKTVNHSGEEYHSDIAVYSFTPVESVKPPEISKAIGEKDGEYIITHINPADGDEPELYYSTSQAIITSNSTVNLSDLKKTLRKATVKNLGDHRYSIDMNGSAELYVYPVICRGETATVGNCLCLRYAKPIKITRSVVSGNKLCLYIDNWVDGADKLFICYNNDVYPQDKDDADKRISISKIEYDRTHMLEITKIQNQKYYISIFARKSGEYIPVCNYLFDNSSNEIKTINYTFKVGFGGSLSVILESKATNLPAIDVCVNDGCVPLTSKDGTVIYTIPSGINGKATVKISNYKVKNNTYASLFTDDGRFTLQRKSGTGKIK